VEGLRALKWIRVYGVFQFLPRASHLLLILVVGLFVHDRYVPVWALWASFALLSLLALGLTFHAFAAGRRDRGPVEPVPMSAVAGLALPMFLTSAMSIVIGQTDTVMLGAMRSEGEVGVYQIALRLGLLAAFILNAVNTMVAPKFSEIYHGGDREALVQLSTQCSRLIFWSTVPVLAALVVLGPWILGWFGPEYPAGYSALLFLAAGQFVNSMSGSVGYFLNMTGDHKVFRNIIMTAAALNVLLNWLLIPRFGIEGAALASMIAVVVWNLASVFYIRRRHGFYIWYLPGLARRRA